MESPAAGPPGTVSRILWHFTGGPHWNEAASCQEKSPKALHDAYCALLGILKSRTLRLGGFREHVKVVVPTRQDPFTLFDGVILPKLPDPPDHLEFVFQSSRVCCVADIPIAHLSYHAARYGQIAIGFHRDALLRAGFRPVFYADHGSAALQMLWDAFKQVDNLASAFGRPLSLADELVEEVERLTCKDGHPVVFDKRSRANIERSLETANDAIQQASTRLENFLAFVKTFSHEEFSTIYCEREWRSTDTFSFTFDDVAMVVVPKAVNTRTLYKEFLSWADDTCLPRSIPVVPWEDLIEH